MSMNYINPNDRLRLQQINKNYLATYGNDLVDGSPYLLGPAGIRQLAANIMRERMMGNIPTYERGLNNEPYIDRWTYPQFYYGQAGNPWGNPVYPRR